MFVRRSSPNNYRVSQNHRKSEVGRDLWRSSNPILPAHSKVGYNRLLRTLSTEILDLSKDRNSIISLGNLFQWLTALTV